MRSEYYVRAGTTGGTYRILNDEPMTRKADAVALAKRHMRAGVSDWAHVTDDSGDIVWSTESL